jgi:hypothetical protein
MSKLLISFAACLLFSQLQAADDAKQQPSGYMTQYEATISAVRTWSSFDDAEHQFIFVLSDGMRWMTSSQDVYYTISKTGWTIGDHLTIWLTPDGWLAKNHERVISVPLIQLCNKGIG